MSLKPTMGHLRESSPRAEDWRHVFGSLDVPLESPLSVRSETPAGEKELYFVAVEKLDEDQVERIVAHLAKKFSVAPEAVREDLGSAHGLPILAEDVSVSFDARFVL